MREFLENWECTEVLGIIADTAMRKNAVGRVDTCHRMCYDTDIVIIRYVDADIYGEVFMAPEVQVEKIKLSDARAELLLTQQKLARLSGVSAKVISNAETGLSIRRLTAHAILNALNDEREKKGKPPLRLDEINWSIYGK